MAVFCTLLGAIGPPMGGALAEKLGGIRSLGVFYSVAAVAMTVAALSGNLWVCGAAFFVASGAFGMCNGSVFQLLPQRFAKDISVMTGLVGCGGGIGGFLLGRLFGVSREYFGGYTPGILFFAGLCLVALAGLGTVKRRWRTTWGSAAMTAARV